MQLPLSLGLALLIVLAVSLGSFHHHDDHHDHPDCAICAVAHHAAGDIAAPSFLAIQPPALPILFSAEVQSAIFSRPTSTLRSRAPPL